MNHIFIPVVNRIAEIGPDERCFLCLDYIANHVHETIKELHISSNSCPGHNSNHTQC
jgi:hypothetical protein